MTVNAREYHRTFNILGPSGRMPSGAELARNLDRELKEARAKYPRFPDHQALALLRADNLREADKRAKRQHHVYLINESQLNEFSIEKMKEILIEEKPDQKFEMFATPWERFWSSLIIRWVKSRLTPVVDSSGEVIGYFGAVNQQYLLVENPLSDYKAVFTGNEILKYHRMYVGTREFYGRKDLKNYEISSWSQDNSFLVVTSVDGEVMDFRLWRVKGEKALEEPYINPLKPLSILKPLLDAEIHGVKVVDVLQVLSLVIPVARAGFRSLSRRAPAPLPSLGPMNTLTGMAVATPTKIPVAFQGRKALVLGDDMAKMTPHVNQIPSQPGLFDVIVHGDKTGFYILKNKAWQKVSVRDLADAIRPKLGPNDKIRLIGCETGVLGGPAQQLGNELGRNMFAPTTTVYPMLGTFWKASHPKFNTIKGGTVYESVKGHLTKVTPDKFGKYVASRGGELVKFVPGKSMVPVDGGTFTEIFFHRGAAQLAGKGGKVFGDELQGEILPVGKK